MKGISSVWVSIRSSLWFVPTMMVGGSIVLAVVLVEADQRYRFQWAEAYPLLFGAGAAGSRGMLSTIAGSMITVAGVTFSLTIAALVTASGQYTSRILRNFMRDRRNQLVLGSFVGIFSYCLVVLRTIRGGDETTFVPSLAVFAGLLLALGGIGVLVFFIHHIATSIQASTIIARITVETFKAMDRVYPAPQGAGGDAARDAGAVQGGARSIVESDSMGYVQGVETGAILALAQELEATVSLEVLAGDFVAESTPLMTVRAAKPLEERQLRAFRAAITVREFRTIDQELGFGIRQLVDIALKALSPGINDTTTAVMCIDHLGAVIARLAPRDMPTHMRSKDGRVRLATRGPRFEDFLDGAFDQVRGNLSRDGIAIAHLIRAIAATASRTLDPGRCARLAHHLELFAEHAHREVTVEHDRAKLREEMRRAVDALGGIAGDSCARLEGPPARV
ncbi:MAG: DUF2254 domain-containing protein [Pseudomonadota bacterium]|nr:DUF2254 domain-containing protein [Pseudomonadota bacterium]